jgi:hypothetical protein
MGVTKQHEESLPQRAACILVSTHVYFTEQATLPPEGCPRALSYGDMLELALSMFWDEDPCTRMHCLSTTEGDSFCV